MDAIVEMCRCIRGVVMGCYAPSLLAGEPFYQYGAHSGSRQLKKLIHIIFTHSKLYYTQTFSEYPTSHISIHHCTNHLPSTLWTVYKGIFGKISYLQPSKPNSGCNVLNACCFDV